MNGYARMHPVGIDVRADMLETVAGYGGEQFERQLAFGVAALDTDDAGACRWLAALLARQIDVLDARDRREAAIAELRAEGWESVADDLAEGLSAEVVLRRLRDIGEVDSDVCEIVARVDA